MDYLELSIEILPREPWNEVVVYQLSELGFDSFVDTDTGILAYAPMSLFEKIKLEDIHFSSELYQTTISHKIIEHQNWNALWEADFEPVHVDDKLSILAPFHNKSLLDHLVIEIQPQMSFGTGHHQTTWLVSREMFNFPIPKTVLDMGTGTGVLAILAEKLGAESILAIDIESWSAENTIENAKRNNCSKIETLCGDIDLIDGKKFGLVLANINKNILKSHMAAYSKALETNGHLLLSGFFDTDADELVTFCENHAITLLSKSLKEGWAMLHMVKN